MGTEGTAGWSLCSVSMTSVSLSCQRGAKLICFFFKLSSPKWLLLLQREGVVSCRDQGRALRHSFKNQDKEKDPTEAVFIDTGNNSVRGLSGSVQLAQGWEQRDVMAQTLPKFGSNTPPHTTPPPERRRAAGCNHIPIYRGSRWLQPPPGAGGENGS